MPSRASPHQCLPLHRYVDKTCSNIVAKAFNGKPSTVNGATDALLTYIELEQGPAVVVSPMALAQPLASAAPAPLAAR